MISSHQGYSYDVDLRVVPSNIDEHSFEPNRKHSFSLHQIIEIVFIQRELTLIRSVVKSFRSYQKMGKQPLNIEFNYNSEVTTIKQIPA